MAACSQYRPLALADVPQWDFETDVAIIGFGATGACAAIEAATAGNLKASWSLGEGVDWRAAEGRAFLRHLDQHLLLGRRGRRLHGGIGIRELPVELFQLRVGADRLLDRGRGLRTVEGEGGGRGESEQ